MTSITIDRKDGLSSSTAIKGPCRAATTANISLTGEQTLDGVAVAAEDRVLVKDQTTASDNGIYIVDTGPWRRSKDFMVSRDVVKGTRVAVTDGTLNGGFEFEVSSENPINVGTDDISITVWHRQSIGEIEAPAFGAVGDGVTDDHAALTAMLDYVRNPSVANLPGGIPRRNLRRRVNLCGRTYAVSQPLDFDNCFGVSIENGTLIAIAGTWATGDAVLMVPNDTGNNPDTFAFKDITIQCNGLTNGIYLNQCALYRIENVDIYGWGEKEFGLKASPVGWSASSNILNCTIQSYLTAAGDENPANYTGVGMLIEQHDIQIDNCTVAGGVYPIHLKGGGLTLTGCHPYTYATGTAPICIYIENQGPVSITSSYIDSGVIWTRATQGVEISNNIFLTGGTSTCAQCIVWEAVSASQQPSWFTATGNIGRGVYTDFITMTTAIGASWSTIHVGVVITNNAIHNISGATWVNPKATRGYVNASVSSAVFDANHIVKVNLNDFLFWPTSQTPLMCAISCTSLDSSLAATIHVENYYFDYATGYLKIKTNANFTGYFGIHFDYSYLHIAPAAVAP